jgi:hypothetical protein
VPRTAAPVAAAAVAPVAAAVAPVAAVVAPVAAVAAAQNIIYSGLNHAERIKLLKQDIIEINKKISSKIPAQSSSWSFLPRVFCSSRGSCTKPTAEDFELTRALVSKRDALINLIGKEEYNLFLDEEGRKRYVMHGSFRKSSRRKRNKRTRRASRRPTH